MKNERARLEHIFEAIEKIEKRLDQGKQKFFEDEMLQVWMIHNIQVIGEAARAIPQKFRDKYPEISWNEMIGMRHVLVHDYFDVDLEIVWDVATTNIPVLKEQISKLLDETK